MNPQLVQTFERTDPDGRLVIVVRDPSGRVLARFRDSAFPDGDPHYNAVLQAFRSGAPVTVRRVGPFIHGGAEAGGSYLVTRTDPIEEPPRESLTEVLGTTFASLAEEARIILTVELRDVDSPIVSPPLSPPEARSWLTGVQRTSVVLGGYGKAGAIHVALVD